MELPLFTGEGVRAWAAECEDVFSLVNIPEEHKVNWGLAHIRGQAKTWLNSAALNHQNLSWQDLTQIMQQRFPEETSAEVMEQLQQLKQ